jgi:hypothetical protein
MRKINWKVFADSSHCAEGLAMFSRGDIATFREFEKYFLPHMQLQAEQVRKMKGLGLLKMRRACARAFRRFEWQSVAQAYNNSRGKIYN